MTATLSAGTLVGMAAGSGVYVSIPGIIEIGIPETIRKLNDITAIDDADQVFTSGRRETGAMTISGFWDPSEPQHIALRDAALAGTETNFLISLPTATSTVIQFAAVPESFTLGAEVDGPITFGLSLQVTGGLDFETLSLFIPASYWERLESTSIGDGTFTRATAATYFDTTTGYRMTATSGTPRYSKDLKTGFVGWEIEPARINYAAYSNAVGGTGWADVTLGGLGTATQASALGADNTLSMTLFQSDVSYYSPAVQQSLAAAIPDDSIVCCSIDVKAGGDTSTWFRIQCKARDNDNTFAYFNCTGSGTTGQIDTGDVDALRSYIVPMANGCYRCSVVFDISSGATNDFFMLTQVASDGGVAVGAIQTGLQGILVNAAQFEIGYFPSSYIENTGSGTATRNRDDLTFPTPTSFPISIGAFYCELMPKASGADLFQGEGGAFTATSDASIFGFTGFGKASFASVTSDQDNPGAFKTTNGDWATPAGHSLTAQAKPVAYVQQNILVTWTTLIKADAFSKRQFFINGSQPWTTNSPVPGASQSDSPAAWNKNPDQYGGMNTTATLEVGAHFAFFNATLNTAMWIRKIRIYNVEPTVAQGIAISEV